MRPGKVQFKKIADILILQINRFPKGTDQLIDTQVLMNFDTISLSPFMKENSKKNKVQEGKDEEEGQKEIKYEFVTAIGIQDGVFPIVCRSKYNNQLYLLKNQSIQMMSKKTKFNPYIICLKRVNSVKTAEFYQEIMKQNQLILENSPSKHKQSEKEMFSRLTLPDFYHLQLKYGIQLPVYQPMVCKHSKIKPFVQRKSTEQISITQKMYEHLVATFKGTQFINQSCNQCQEEMSLINQRKYKEKQLVKEYDLYKTNCNVMVAIGWLKKWSNYLYSNDNPSYLHKGYPMPPSIDNTILLENNKCRSNLVKNKDFKVVNIFVFKLLKQLYSGGPEIRYKWKNSELGHVDEVKIKEIRNQAAELKGIYSSSEAKSPNRSVILEKSSSYMETVNETEMEDDFELQEKEKD